MISLIQIRLKWIDLDGLDLALPSPLDGKQNEETVEAGSKRPKNGYENERRVLASVLAAVLMMMMNSYPCKTARAYNGRR